MKNVRVIFKKRGELRFISHLDMNRFIPRIIRKTNIPVWYTEGFNSHIYINFALPLSLGFESDYEVLDIKLTDDNYPNESVFEELKRVVPNSIEIIDVVSPWFKVGDIGFAEFEITFEDNGEIYNQLKTFLEQPSILTLKKTKKGAMKEVELADKIKKFELTSSLNNTILKIILSAGSDNINPTLLLNAFQNQLEINLPDYAIKRTLLYTNDLKVFI